MEPIASSNGIVLAKELVRFGVDDGAFRKASARGELVRVHRGAYMDAGEWQRLDRHERYRRRVTGLQRTLLDLAATSTFASAVASVDYALRCKLTTTAALRRRFEALPHLRLRTRVNRVLDFATPLAGSPGESLSRANIHELGFPVPELQVVFDDRGGRVGDVDFWWRMANLIGEFDGLVKYTRAGYTQGRPIEEIVIAEKVREDRLRALGPNVSRWLWGVALRPRELYAHLSSAGLRPVRV